jgi:tetratricopeptide (TPR) repeat protein
MKLLRIFLLTSLICFVTVAAAAQTQKRAPVAQTADNAAALLELGDFYSRSNDISDAADRYYQQAIRSSPGSQTAGNAQYNRANYWFRKYYVLKEQYSKEDSYALRQAEEHYYNFIDKFAKQTGTGELIADAEFYLALVYLQQGRARDAVGWLNVIGQAAKEDQSIYVYQVAWSSKPADVVDRHLDAAKLANYARYAIENGKSVELIIFDIKRWCQKQ